MFFIEYEAHNDNVTCVTKMSCEAYDKGIVTTRYSDNEVIMTRWQWQQGESDNKVRVTTRLEWQQGESDNKVRVTTRWEWQQGDSDNNVMCVTKKGFTCDKMVMHVTVDICYNNLMNPKALWHQYDEFNCSDDTAISMMTLWHVWWHGNMFDNTYATWMRCLRQHSESCDALWRVIENYMTNVMTLWMCDEIVTCVTKYCNICLHAVTVKYNQLTKL